MRTDLIPINYAYEYGDHSLPHLKDLISDIPDPEKNKIIKYLKTNCILASSGIIRDVLDSDKTIGAGNVYSDGKYCWNDALIGYVNKYNIMIPEEFRCHILQNYTKRMKCHVLLKMINLIEINNNPCLEHSYSIKIYKKGNYEYLNNTDCIQTVIGKISKENAQYIIDPIMTDLFCYDTDNHGSYVKNGYHWQIRFFKNDELIYETDGWNNEDEWRYIEFRKILNFIERYIPQKLSTDYIDKKPRTI